MRHIARQVALTVGALLGVVCVVSTFAVHVFGIAPLVVRSGSMEPTMPVGSLALAVPVRGPDLHPDDVVSVSEPNGGRVTHRVVSTAASSQVAVTAYLKGDANRHPDPAPYVIGSATRVVVVVPLAGYVVSWTQTPAGRVLAILTSLSLLYVGFRRRSSRHRGFRHRGFRRKGFRHRRSGDDDSDHSRLPPTVHQARPSARNTRYRARHASATGAITIALSVAVATQQVGTANAAPLTDTATMVGSVATGTFGNSIPGVRGAVAIATATTASGCKITWTAPSAGFSVQVSFLPKGVVVPADHDPTPTTYQSQHTLTASTLGYVATAPADVVGTDATSANGQIFTVRTVRTSDQLVSANFAYGYVYTTSSGNYGCGVRSTDGTANYTWPIMSAGVQSFALRAPTKSAASSTTAVASPSSSSAPSTTATSESTSAASTTPPSSPAPTGSTAHSPPGSPGTDSTAADSTAADSTASDSTVASTVTAAASGTTSPSSKVTAAISGTTLTLTDMSSGATLFTDTVQSGSTLAWAATDDTLTVYQPDGTTVLVRKVGTNWQSDDIVNNPAVTSTMSSAPTSPAPTSTTAATPASSATESAASTSP